MDQTKLELYANLSESIEALLHYNKFEQDGGVLTDYVIIFNQVSYDLDDDGDMSPIPGYGMIFRNGYMLPHHSRGMLEVAKGMLDAADMSDRFGVDE